MVRRKGPKSISGCWWTRPSDSPGRRRQVAPGPLARRARQRGLDHQHVGAFGERDELLAGPGVGAEHESAIARGDLDGERLDEVVDLVESDPQRADLDRVVDRILAQREGLLDQVFVAPRADDPAEGAAPAVRD